MSCRTYLTLAAALALAYSLFVPPWLAVERAHFLRAYQLADRALGGDGTRVPVIVLRDMTLVDEVPRPSWLQVFDRSHHWNAKKLAAKSAVTDDAGVFRQLVEAPQALVCVAGRIFGSRTLVVFYLARFAGLTFIAVMLRVALQLLASMRQRRFLAMLAILVAGSGTASLCLGTAAWTGLVLLLFAVAMRATAGRPGSNSVPDC